MQILDGAMGTELRRRGFELRAPLFASAAIREAPELCVQVHRDYLRAGARILTTNTFMLGAPDSEHADAIALAHDAVARVRTAIEAEAGDKAVRVAGNLGPHEQLSEAAVRALAHALVDAGADLLLVETATSVAWARRALAACRELGVPLWLSCAWRGGVFLNGDDPRELLDDPPPDLLAANCFELEHLGSNVDALRELADSWGVRRLGVWPNLSRVKDGAFEAVAHADAAVAQALAEHAQTLDVIGTCCGSTPATTAALHQRLT